MSDEIITRKELIRFRREKISPPERTLSTLAAKLHNAILAASENTASIEIVFESKEQDDVARNTDLARQNDSARQIVFDAGYGYGFGGPSRPRYGLRIDLPR